MHHHLLFFKTFFKLLPGIALFFTINLLADDKDSGSAESTQSHQSLFLENKMPAASTCKACHPKHYQEWSISQHAYSQLSPVYHTFQAALNRLTNNTNGDFCIRCHTPVGMNIGEPLFMDNLKRHPTSQEGITCITCHRVDSRLGKISGRLPIIQGDITQPVYGPSGNKNLALALNNSDLKITTDANERGQKIHNKAEKFSFLSASGFCGTCHDVTLVNGFRLEEAFSEYKSSPAAKRGESCQDCHMGKTPGVASGYEVGPAAIVKGFKTPDRKLTDHRFVGPDYSVIHPGLFPHNPEMVEFIGGIENIHEWLSFNYKAGWGTDEFEEKLETEELTVKFPEVWDDPDYRIEAREFIDAQLQRLEEMAEARKSLLQLAYVLKEPELIQANSQGIKFKIAVQNGTDGHNVPTGFTGERQVWLQVEVKDADGKVIFESGDLDPNGDVRDLHSLYVHNDELELDKQLFSLQSKFITRNIRGGEREQILAINHSPDPLPFLRPDVRPTILTGRILGARIHKKSIEPNGHRWAEYAINAEQLSGKPPYSANIQLKAAMIPVNLVAAISAIGFDYDMSAQDVADGVLAGHQVLYKKELMIDMGNKGE